MATIKEWVRDFRKKPKWDQFSIIFAVIIGIVGLFVGGNYLINIASNNNQLHIDNSTLIKSPIVQGSSNVSIVYSEDDNSAPPNPSIYSKLAGALLNFEIPELGGKVNIYNVKYILPDGQIVFLKEMKFNETYQIAQCNQEYTDCYIYHKFRAPELQVEEICWEAGWRDGGGAQSQSKFRSNPSSCFSVIN